MFNRNSEFQIDFMITQLKIWVTPQLTIEVKYLTNLAIVLPTKRDLGLNESPKFLEVFALNF